VDAPDSVRMAVFNIKCTSFFILHAHTERAHRDVAGLTKGPPGLGPVPALSRRIHQTCVFWFCARFFVFVRIGSFFIFCRRTSSPCCSSALYAAIWTWSISCSISARQKSTTKTLYVPLSQFPCLRCSIFFPQTGRSLLGVSLASRQFGLVKTLLEFKANPNDYVDVIIVFYCRLECALCKYFCLCCRRADVCLTLRSIKKATATSRWESCFCDTARCWSVKLFVINIFWSHVSVINIFFSSKKAGCTCWAWR
jgi:hypothetical protein